MPFIFDFRSYKKYLSEVCAEERGRLSRLAEAAGCQKSYLSSCLKGKNNLTLDQAFAIAQYLELSEQQQDFFFFLIDRERAATKPLQQRLDAKLKELAREAYRIKNQHSDTVIVDEAAQSFGTYYSNWLMTAIHTLASVPRYQTIEQIAKRLELPIAQAAQILGDLVALGLVKREGKAYRWHSGNIHLPDSSPWITAHHSNWRVRSMQVMQMNHRRDASSLHLTHIQSMSEADFEILKTKIVKFVKDFTKVADPSEPEEAYCFSVDFFRV